MQHFLSDFQVLRPPYEIKQEATLKWLVKAHTQAEKQSKKEGFNELEFAREIEEKLAHVGCGNDAIGKRGHVLTDFSHDDWEKMEVYRLNESPNGLSIDKRNEVYGRFVLVILKSFYAKKIDPPKNMIHVTCTGYLSPSPLQVFVSQKGWGKQTTIQHAYHMGCYAAFPAIQMGWGRNVEIIHTEICSLHTNTASHDADQLVAQSLFADGFIRYQLTSKPETNSLKILALHEEILPDSHEAMIWNLSPWGFQLNLSKEIPVLISRALPGFLEALCQKANRNLNDVKSNARFAIHPGGPKILNYVKKILGLDEVQIEDSRHILKEHGNMSSATLPHIWKKMSTQPGFIVSLAFGPGLSIHGGMMEVIC